MGRQGTEYSLITSTRSTMKATLYKDTLQFSLLLCKPDGRHLDQTHRYPLSYCEGKINPADLNTGSGITRAGLSMYIADPLGYNRLTVSEKRAVCQLLNNYPGAFDLEFSYLGNHYTLKEGQLSITAPWMTETFTKPLAELTKNLYRNLNYVN